MATMIGRSSISEALVLGLNKLGEGSRVGSVAEVYVGAVRVVLIRTSLMCFDFLSGVKEKISIFAGKNS